MVEFFTIFNKKNWTKFWTKFVISARLVELKKMSICCAVLEKIRIWTWASHFAPPSHFAPSSHFAQWFFVNLPNQNFTIFIEKKIISIWFYKSFKRFKKSMPLTNKPVKSSFSKHVGLSQILSILPKKCFSKKIQVDLIDVIRANIF